MGTEGKGRLPRASGVCARERPAPETAQRANAALGLLVAVVARLLVRLPRTPLVRWPVLVVSWAGIATVGAGVLGFGARAAGLAPGLGATPPHMPTALAALLLGAVGATAWTVATVSATRGSRRQHTTRAHQG
ncbi:hypothetical protein [Streptomyces sp. NPDC058701]|uniref:hypothetical protein n=1 Tax=Streptomyces sp. NPDC058701 TaxID=3346608 RepID=UPI00366963D7